ncbi:Thiol-disulfide isomerase or thioredoxin [Poseidonocella pacifica]|uniref:Thiol-disulfide isomerase or thioredoxin n=1 Tax=Poseidonocella pacifica TaxID=871651 RepID=A0A1I0WNZ7_9RHOB|nr:TlpA disulfide reductase family protein [Poseidonocella pacifica]SFA90479.1 Thiol-disulfide isomerase or thioredoxin [Poseidonocella pacifica]
MGKLFAAAVYTALLVGANATHADIASLREGDMKKLVVHTEPRGAATEVTFETASGGTATLSDYAGKYVLLNFWATWCAPCREEMPMLSELQSSFGGEDFEVVTVATGRNMPAAIDRFFAEIDVDNLPRHRDPKQALARRMAVLGLPITVLLNPEGLEIARLQGDADWSSESAKAIIAALLAQPEG